MDLNNDINPDIVRQHVLDLIIKWRGKRTSDSFDNNRFLVVSSQMPMPLNRLEAIFIVGNLRHELPLEGKRKNRQTTDLLLRGGSWLDEAIDVFVGFLQETLCHLLSLHLYYNALQPQQFHRLLQALQINKSVKNIALDCLRGNDIALVEELLHHKKDFTNLAFTKCRFNISPALPNLLSGLRHLTTLTFYLCDINDEAVQVMLQVKYTALINLNLYYNQITSNGLGILARRIRETLPSLENLNLNHNPDLLKNPANTRLFTQNVLPMLKELDIQFCGEDLDYIPVIKACEAETVGDRLDVLDIVHFGGPSQAIRNQLIKSLPKMRVKRIRWADGFLTHTDQALMSAFYKNTSIIELFKTQIDDETRRHIAPIFRRNLHSWHVHGLLRPPPPAVPTLSNGNGENSATATACPPLFLPPRGLWPQVLATVGQDSQGATPVFEILRDRLGCWIKLDDNGKKELAGFAREQLVEMVVFRNEQIEQLQQKIEQQVGTVSTITKLAAISAVLNVVVVLGLSWKACRK